MMKRYFIFMAMTVLAAVAATAGTWRMHNYYAGANVRNIYDTDNRVYYLNSGHLYQFDKATCVTTALSSQNLLSDENISQVYYDYANKLLFIAYSNCNIDIIDANNKKTNITNLRDASIRLHHYILDDKNNLSSYTGKGIIDITFSRGMAYVAAGFGYIVIDESTFKVVEDKFIDTNINVNSVAVLSDELMLILSNTFCYYGPVGTEDPIANYKKIQKTTFEGGHLFPIDDHSAFILAATVLYHVDFSSTTPTVTTLVSAKPTIVQKTPSGYIANFEGQKFYYKIDASGKMATQASSERGFASSNPAGDGTVWISDANGLHIKNSTVYYKLSAMTTDQPYWLKYNTAMDLLYVGVSAKNMVTNINDLPANVMNTYDGTEWADATAFNANGGGYEFVFNPLDSTTYVRASWNTGLYKVTNNVFKLIYNKANSPMGTYKAHPAFDKYGNMWIVSSYGSKACPVAVLTKDKVAKNTVKMSDWFQPTGLLKLNTEKMQRSRFIISKLNNYKIYTDGDFSQVTSMQGRILCWDNGNEDPTVDNYRFASTFQFIDQDNRTLRWTNLSHMEEDADGMIWVGHLTGLFAFDPNVLFDENPRAYRPCVTNCELEEDRGFLCEGYTVYDIGIDRYNNKWLATNNGVYFVSPDGTTIYEHFMTQNSDIPSNEVYSVECDPEHDKVYIFTSRGFAEYIGTEDAPSLDYNNVNIYPNPVEPDFTGMIKIAGLMENSYVTVTNKEGAIVAQMGPVTGSALWDGSGSNGERVPTGIYSVYAAQGSQPVITGKPLSTVVIIR